MTHTPAHIMREVLINHGEAYLPPDGVGSDWPVYVGSLPITGDRAIALYNMTGNLEGRYMSTGETVDHPQVHFSVRGRNDVQASEKLLGLMEMADTISREAVSLDGKDYTVQAVHRRTGILSFGEEPERQRNVVAFNAIVTILEN